MAANPSIQLGTDGNWAIKEDNLLAYKKDGDRFFNKEFDFTRGSFATFVDKDGLIKTVTSDIPRIDFTDDATGHLLLEPQSTNLVTYSEDLTRWSSVSSGIQLTSGQLGVGNSNDAWKIQRSLAYDYIRSIISFTSTSTVSVYAKKGSYNFLRIAISSIPEQCYFDLENGIIGTTSNLISSDIKYINNGWYRCSMTFNNSNGTGVYIQPVETDGGIGNSGTGYIFVQYPQTEALSYATSYIPTQGSAVTRSVEKNSISNISQLLSSSGVIYAEIKLGASTTNTSSSNIRFSLSEGGSANNWVFFGIESGDNLRTYVRASSNTSTDAITNGVFPSPGIYKVAFRFDLNNTKVFVNGIQKYSDTSSTPPSTSTLSSYQTGGVGIAASNIEEIVEIKETKLYNTALTDAELIALTS